MIFLTGTTNAEALSAREARLQIFEVFLVTVFSGGCGKSWKVDKRIVYDWRIWKLKILLQTISEKEFFTILEFFDDWRILFPDPL